MNPPQAVNRHKRLSEEELSRSASRTWCLRPGCSFRSVCVAMAEYLQHSLKVALRELGKCHKSLSMFILKINAKKTLHLNVQSSENVPLIPH